jgi:hypothetical protein
MSKYTPITSSQPATGSFTSDPQDIQLAESFAVQYRFTGATIAGTATVECSTDLVTLPGPPATSASSATWNTVTSVSATGDFTLNISKQQYPYFRVKWADSGTTSSNATVDIVSFVKGV